MTGDFPDRDEWTDKPDSPEQQEAAAELREMFDEAAEWEALGDTDLISPEELADIVRPITPTGETK